LQKAIANCQGNAAYHEMRGRRPHGWWWPSEAETALRDSIHLRRDRAIPLLRLDILLVAAGSTEGGLEDCRGAATITLSRLGNAARLWVKIIGMRAGGLGRVPLCRRIKCALGALAIVAGGLAPLSLQAEEQRSVKSLLEFRRDRVVVQQWDISCGAAAVATLLTYQHADPVTEKEVALYLIKREEYLQKPELVRLRQGFSLLDMERYVAQRGYKGIGYGKLTLHDLKENAPVIVSININGYSHFVIFRGVMRDRVLLADPAWGNRTMTTEQFQNAWIDYGAKMGRVGFVILPHDGKQPLNRLAPKAKDFVTLN
jgi:predicted double-glycine peptidase